MPVMRAATTKDDWQTPDVVIKAVRQLGEIGLDPCAGKGEFANRNLVPPMDGLLEPWRGHGLVYVNPPFSQKAKWVARAASEAANGTEIVFLCPASPCAVWFDPLLDAQAICFWRGRMRFTDGGVEIGPAMFDCCLVYFGLRTGKFIAAFQPHGLCLMLPSRAPEGRRRRP